MRTKKLLGVLLTLALVIGMIPMTTMTASAATTSVEFATHDGKVALKIMATDATASMSITVLTEDFLKAFETDAGDTYSYAGPDDVAAQMGSFEGSATGIILNSTTGIAAGNVSATEANYVDLNVTKADHANKKLLVWVYDSSEDAASAQTANVTLNSEGKLPAAKHTVTYNLDGGTGTVPTQADVEEGLTFTVANGTGLTKTGYRFSGWSDGTKTYQAGATYTMGTADVTLTAQWTQVYTLTYDANGGTGTVPTDTNTYAAGEEVTLKGDNGLTKTGFVFQGWSESGNAPVIAGGKYTMPAANTTLKAVWGSIITLTAADFSIEGTYTYTGLEQTATVKISDTHKDKVTWAVVGDSNKATEAGAHTITINVTGDGTKYDDATVTLTWNIDKATPTLTWPTELTYTEGSDAGVTVNSSFGTPTVTYEIVTVEHKDAEGTCACPGGSGSHDATNTDCTYKPEVDEVKVTGALNDAGVKDALKALKAGDTFDVKASVAEDTNWNAAAEETKTFTVAATAPVSGGGGGVSNNFTVTYNAGSHGALAAGAKSSEQVKRNESPKNVPAVVANAGYAFIGWTADGKTLVDPAAQTITKNTTFTAVYGDHLNYMVGRSAMEFVPNGNLTRAEAAAILSRLTEGFAEDGTYPAAPYSDLVSGAWYVKYINFAADKGIVNGRTDGTFDPDANITRAEFATMIANFAKIAPVDTAAVSTDVAGHWAEGYIAALEQAKIVTGYEDGTFKPNNSITRAEAATMVNGAIGRVPMTGLDLSVNGYDNPFVDVNESQWFYGQVMEATVDHVTAHFHK